MNCALKLALMIAELASKPELVVYMRRNIGADLIAKVILKYEQDEKLKQILTHVQKLVHQLNQEAVDEESKEEKQQTSAKESAEAKKAVLAKKKQMLMQKMKDK